MKKYIAAALTAAAIAAVCTIPAYAHHRGGESGHNRRHYIEEACSVYCQDDILCGTDGHYCETHRTGNEADCEGSGCLGGVWAGETCENHEYHHNQSSGHGGCRR